MYSLSKKIRIAVIGARSSGKSFLLYDLIHAFSVLGFKPEELPLDYPHSSFGAYFYDTFNSTTGGMRGTESYACRPRNHYGAYLSGRIPFSSLSVDFLNIPGEVFDAGEKRVDVFFKMKDIIEDRGDDYFYLAQWESPSSHIVKLIVPEDFDPNIFMPERADIDYKHMHYLSWNNIISDLNDGSYKETKREKVSGKYIFKHIVELNTDSLLLTLEECWPSLSKKEDHLDWLDIEGLQVKHYFYPLAYCLLATDIVLCDKLTDDDNISSLSETICQYFDESKEKAPHVYLAFRAADALIKDCERMQECIKTIGNGTHVGIRKRNEVYSIFYSDLESGSIKNEKMDQHIRISVGDSFRRLLNYSYHHNSWTDIFSRKKSMTELLNSTKHFLPPHVYLTATPIEAHFRIYDNDRGDVTRFYHNDGVHRKSFTREVLDDMTQHMCFGSLQLLTDILIQNEFLMLNGAVRERSEILKYFQYKT